MHMCSMLPHIEVLRTIRTMQHICCIVTHMCSMLLKSRITYNSAKMMHCHVHVQHVTQEQDYVQFGKNYALSRVHMQHVILKSRITYNSENMLHCHVHMQHVTQEQDYVQFGKNDALGGTSTNVGPTNVGLYKGRTVQTSDLQTSDWYKHRTGTNVGLRQTSDQYKRRTSTNVGRVHLLGKTSDFG